MKPVIRSLSIVLLLCVPLFAGCSNSGPVRADAEGKVLVDGEPVLEGAIIFIPVEGVKGPPTQLAIKDGTYSTSINGKGIVVGTSSVYISGVKTTGKKVRDMSSGDFSDEYVEIVPAKYNQKTTLSVDVKEGMNTFDFDLQGKAPTR